MKNNPLVSIIMPAYKAENFIQNPVRSVLAQTYNNWELVISSDDGQDYKEILKKSGLYDDRIKFCTTGKTASGPSCARNIAIDNANGDIIATLDSDDEFANNKLEVMVPKVLVYGMATSAYERIIYENQRKLKVEDSFCHTESSAVTVEEFLSINFSTNSLIIFDRKKIPVKYPTYIGYLEDLILSVSCFDYIEKSYHFSDKLHHWLKRSDSLSNCSAAPKNFIAAKKLVLSKIADKSITISSAKSLRELQNFIQMSLDCEKVFTKLIETSEEYIDFVEIFIKEISKLYPNRIYEYKGVKYSNGITN